MSKTKEELLTLVQQAIPNPDAGIVNFRVLRDVLAATVDRPLGATGPKSNARGSKSIGGSPKLTTNMSNIIKINEMDDLMEKLSSVMNQLDAFRRKFDKLNERVTNIENLMK